MTPTEPEEREDGPQADPSEEDERESQQPEEEMHDHTRDD